MGAIGYGGRVVSGLGGALEGQTLASISAIAKNPLRVEQRTRRVEDGAGGNVEQSFKFPLWVEAKATGKTPMCGAFKQAQQYLQEFLARFPGCYPPLVVNITDGESSDGDPLPAAQAVRNLASKDGNVLVFNAHLSETQAQPIEFPASEGSLPDKFAKQLFQMSSMLPPPLLEAARTSRVPVREGARGFVFNADLVSVIGFLELGTKVAQGVR